MRRGGEEEMNYWRMAFRIGSKGYEMWPDCFERGIAAIGYYKNGKPVVEDCSKLTEDEYDEIWRRKRPRAISARNSLKNVAYKMEEGDVIYVKKGTDIVGKGVITKEYKYDPTILKGTKAEWEHFVTVDWGKNFSKFRLVLGADQITVLKLEGERLNKIREKESQALKKITVIEANEGEKYTSEATFRARNRALIEAKNANSDYRCEVCNMSFKEVYGNIGEGYIIAHHVNPIGSRKKASMTALDDIALVCSNCHDMLHRTEPPISLSELRYKIR